MLQTQEDNLAPSITIKNLSKNNTLSFDGNQVIEFLISFSMSIASGVIGNYIYNAIHSSARKIEINNRRTRLTEESISQAIETAKELLKKQKKNRNILFILIKLQLLFVLLAVKRISILEQMPIPWKRY